MFDRNSLLALLLCLAVSACGGGTGEDGSTAVGFRGEGFSWDPSVDVAGTRRAEPSATMGALEII